MAPSQFQCGCGRTIKGTGHSKDAHEKTQMHQRWLASADAPPEATTSDYYEDSTTSTVVSGVPVKEESVAMTGIPCEVCGAGPFMSIAEIQTHLQGDSHVSMRADQARVLREQKEATQESLAGELLDDLKAPVVAIGATPQDRAKMVRAAFGARGWPNSEHPGTVREFLMKYGIPIAPGESRPMISDVNAETERERVSA